ncbi:MULTISPECIES: YihY/virulence factor BrkB family protein [unclassified Duganella]|uniref:YihY/virulence factor BrkB family protein n=1 Tax=unclassified Duganella TaxID=2636909 RepID=UPI000891F5B2|nr:MULTISPECIES: YihY/virulence factor BrkB family protein [unclassified Duganella]SDH27097.1 YihY family inner membrane protein [Duganella sp. OV458]SDK40878.1 YihY family inner membrane protein [Duganella sp. OV510]
MKLFNRRALAYVASHPMDFTVQCLKGFRANQGLLLAGAVAYYSLLSILPLLMLVVVALSHVIDQAELLSAVGRYLNWLVPGQSRPIVAEVAHFLEHRDLVGGVLVVTMLFFSSLAFTVLENAMCVIFKHRVAIRRRHFMISAVMPYCYILSLGAGMLLVTLVAGSLQVMGEESVRLFGYSWSLNGVSGVLLYLLGFVGEVLVLSSIYLVMPVGRLSLSHALIGGVTAALLWEIARRILVWYFSTLSQVNVVYGSMTTAIIVMFSLEIGATLLLFGAQVISEFERVGRERPQRAPRGLVTEAPVK